MWSQNPRTGYAVAFTIGCRSLSLLPQLRLTTPQSHRDFQCHCLVSHDEMRDYPAVFEIWGNCIIRRRSPEGATRSVDFVSLPLVGCFCSVSLVIVANGGFDGTTWSPHFFNGNTGTEYALCKIIGAREGGFRDHQGVCISINSR